MVIVEGCFRMENSATARHIVGSLPAMRWPPRMTGPADSAGLISYMSSILGECLKSTQRMVFDGFPLLTELAYGPVVGGGVAFTPQQVAILKDRLRLHDPLCVYCLREPLDPRALREEAARGGWTADQLRAVMARYEAMMREPWVTRPYRHNLALDEPERVVEAVRAYLGGLPYD